MALGDQSDPVLVKRGDTRPILRYTATQGTGAAVPTPSGTTVVFNMRPEDNDTPIVSRGSADIVTDQGVMQYVWGEDDFDTTGLYQTEFEVTFPDGGVQTFPPGDTYIWVSVGEDIA